MGSWSYFRTTGQGPFAQPLCMHDGTAHGLDRDDGIVPWTGYCAPMIKAYALESTETRGGDRAHGLTHMGRTPCDRPRWPARLGFFSYVDPQRSRAGSYAPEWADGSGQESLLLPMYGLAPSRRPWTAHGPPSRPDGPLRADAWGRGSGTWTDAHGPDSMRPPSVAGQFRVFLAR